MTTLVITRHFLTPPEKVFQFLTDGDRVSLWWGPESMTCEGQLNLGRLGDWHSIMRNKEGQRYKVSGVVVSISRPNFVEFTWGWHDQNDARGTQTLVRFDVASDGLGGTNFTLTQGDFDDPENMKSHSEGWNSSLRKLNDKLN